MRPVFLLFAELRGLALKSVPQAPLTTLKPSLFDLMVRRTRRPVSRPVCRPALRRLSSLVLAAVAAAFAPAHAAELGDSRVSSHIGQPLVADIELALIDDAGAPVQVRLASPEVYNGAGIAMPAVLSSLNLSVMRRDGRQFLHATTLRPVEAGHLHLYVELLDKGQRVVRLATLWLTPDPNPAPVRAPAPVAAPAPPAVAVAPVAVAAPAPVPVSAPAAPAPRPVAPAPRARPAAPPAATPPVPAAVRAEPKAAPIALPGLPLAAARAGAHPPACLAQAEDAKACMALGEKNAELRAQLGKLEEKVRGLQVALGVAPAGAAAAAAAHPAPAPHAAPAPAAPEPPAHKAATHAAPAAPVAAHEDAPAGAGATAAADAPPRSGDKAEDKPENKPDIKPEIKPAGPKPIRAIKPLVPRKPKDKDKEAAPDEGLPWGWIGAALALLGLGAGGVVLARRGKPRPPGTPAAPGLVDRLKARFGARARPAPAPAAQAAREAEPSLE